MRGAHTFAASLKACAKNKDLHRGSQIHAEIVVLGLLNKDVFAGSALVNMYAKCGSLVKAQEVLYTLSNRNVVSWNALIAGYAQHGYGEQVLHCFEQMQQEGISPDEVTFVCTLKACATIGAVDKGQEIQAQMGRLGHLGEHVFVGTALVDMYAKCGLLTKAQEVLDKFHICNTISWNALITGYVQHRHYQEAFDCYRRMKLDGICPDAVTFICILKACGNTGAADKGIDIHAEVGRMKLLEKDIFLGCALVDMYAKCGLLANAQEVLENLPSRNVVLWNALIAGYIQHGHSEGALACVDRMRKEGLSPNLVTFLCILKACGSTGAAYKGQEIHAEVVKERILEKHVVVGNALVDMYAKCGLLVKAQEVFDNLSSRDLVSWNGLISGYVQHGRNEEALNCFSCLQLEGLFPDVITYVAILKACGSSGMVNKGQEIHAQIMRDSLLEKHVLLGTALVDMYAKCSFFAKAREVFDTLQVRDVVSWGALIVGYVQQGQFEKAVNYFERMQLEGISSDRVTFVSVLKACGSIKAIDKGQKLHTEIVREGLQESDEVGTALIEMYFKCGWLETAQGLFEQLSNWTTASWNVLIAGYVQHGLCEEAIDCFEKMQLDGNCTHATDFVNILKACGGIGAIDKGQEVHFELLRWGSLEKHVTVGNALVDMYIKCGLLAKAQEVFSTLPLRDLVSWNVLITGYVQHGHIKEALNCYDWMRLEGFLPNSVTYACILKACGSMGAADKGQEIHAEVVREGLLGKHTVVGNALVDMYAKCGLLVKALEVFVELPVRDVVTWNVLITGYVQHGHGEEALSCFDQMQSEAVVPDNATFVCVLKACGSIGAADRGEEIHAKVLQEGLLDKDINIGNAVVDMYGKCGLLAKAQEVFDNLRVKDGVTWNALITGYALIADAESVSDLLTKMLADGAIPNCVTFTSVLNACSHTGLLEKGQIYFETMCTVHGIIPTLEHHACMVDLFGRAGSLDKAKAVIKGMPFFTNLSVWHTMMSACRGWGDVELGTVAFKYALQLAEEDVASFLCMNSIYLKVGRQQDAIDLEAMLMNRQAR